MNTYRLMVWHAREEDSIKLEGLELTKSPVFVETDKELDEHKLFGEGIAVKKYESPPENVTLTRLPQL